MSAWAQDGARARASPGSALIALSSSLQPCVPPQRMASAALSLSWPPLGSVKPAHGHFGVQFLSEETLGLPYPVSPYLEGRLPPYLRAERSGHRKPNIACIGSSVAHLFHGVKVILDEPICQCRLPSWTTGCYSQLNRGS